MYKAENVRFTNEHSFSCFLVKDGKRIATVHADEDANFRYEWEDRNHEKELLSYVKNLPEAEIPNGKGKFRYDLDLFIARRVDDFEIDKKLREACKTRTLFRVTLDPPDRWRVLENKYGVSVKEYLKEKYADKIEEIANERFLK
jgi:hypothetical protein